MMIRSTIIIDVNGDMCSSAKGVIKAVDSEAQRYKHSGIFGTAGFTGN